MPRDEAILVSSCHNLQQCHSCCHMSGWRPSTSGLRGYIVFCSQGSLFALCHPHFSLFLQEWIAGICHCQHRSASVILGKQSKTAGVLLEKLQLARGTANSMGCQSHGEIDSLRVISMRCMLSDVSAQHSQLFLPSELQLLGLSSPEVGQ